MASHGDALHLFDLPIDILSLILQHLLIVSSPVAMCPCSPAPSLPASPVAIFLIHPSIYGIASPLFYSANTFELDMTGEHATHVRRFLVPREWDLVGPRTALLGQRDALRRVRRMRLRMDKLRGWVGDAVVPLVSDKIVRGSLTDFSLSIHSSAASSGSSRNRPVRKPSAPTLPSTDMFTRPPFPGLLSLLADPYLHGAHLFVERTLGPAWRRFQLDTRPQPEMLTGMDTETGTERLRPAESGAEVEIDWRAIIREVDPEGRDVPREWAEDWAVRNRV